MSTNETDVKRLYLMQVATRDPGNTPFVCYLVQMTDGKNILIDTGLPIEPIPAQPGMTLETGKNVIEQLAEIGIKPDDIDTLIATHFDGDHAGNLGAFPRAQLIVQKAHYDNALTNPRFDRVRAQWDQPVERYRFVEGDTVLLPGLELIESSGHVVGHQSILVRLPKTGTVLLTIDAVTTQERFIPDAPEARMDSDHATARASIRKLLDLAQREKAALVVFGHDGQQWATLKKLPEYYE